jgi:Bles03-like protein
MTKSHSKPDLDLIDIVQRARMMHDSAVKPSEISGVYWIEAKPQNESLPPTGHAGEWHIQTTLAEVDGLWEAVKQATQVGRLGYKAKVSTAPGPGQSDSKARLILICTRDSTDAADVKRVSEALLALGIRAEMNYQPR